MFYGGFHVNQGATMTENGDYTDSVDPRVHIELERLNSATDEINRLEVDLDEARASFRQLLCDSTARVDAIRVKLGLCIERAKPYYEARFCANEALKQTQVAAMRYERANSAHSAAREMVYLAEQGLGGRTLGNECFMRLILILLHALTAYLK